MQPKVSIVIPVFNEERILAACLESLVKIDYPRELLEIIIVDNNSTDSSAAIIKSFPVTYVHEPRKGRSAARNRGIREATGEFVAFTDADCIVEPSWITELTEGFSSPLTACCGGRTLSYYPENWIEGYFDWINKQQSPSVTYFENYLIGPVFATCNLACRRSVLEETGLFDETLAASEDVDLVWRINLKGYPIAYADAAVVYHKRRDTLRELPEVFFQYMYWQYYLVKKYERVIGVSFDWLKIFGKIVRGAGTAVLRLLQGRQRECVFNLFVALLSVMQVAAAVYFRLESALGAAVQFSPLAFVPAPVIWRWGAEDEVMILNLERRAGYTLDGAGARVWTLLAEARGAEQIARTIADEYGIPAAQAAGDVRDLVGQFSAEGLLRPEQTQSNGYV